MQEKIQQELNDLVTEGQETLKHTDFIGIRNVAQISLGQQRYQMFRTRSLNIIRRGLGSDSDHYLAIQGLEGYVSFSGCLGIVEAALHDFEAGLLFDMKALIHSEVLGNFIEQAGTLLGAGYYVPAASLAGAVLEDSLRQLWAKQGSTSPVPSNINSLNAELYREGVYNNAVQKQITAYADIRNNADHGHPDEFKSEDVAPMIEWIQRFSSEYLR